MTKIILSVLLLFSSLNALSAEYVPTNKWRQVSGLKAGAKFFSIWESRGVIQYNDFQLVPVVALFMFEDRFEFLTSSVSYRDFVYEDKIRLRTRLQAISDDPIFPKHDSIKDIYPNREGSWEWVNRVEFFIPGYNEDYISEFDFGIHKDLKAHNGLYYELTGKLKLFTFQNTILRTSMVEPNLIVTLGAGDKRHNEYYYGAIDSNGLNNLSYGVWFHFNDLSDRNNPVITVKHFEVLGDKNKNGILARDRNEGWAATFTYTHDLLK